MKSLSFKWSYWCQESFTIVHYSVLSNLSGLLQLEAPGSFRSTSIFLSFCPYSLTILPLSSQNHFPQALQWQTTGQNTGPGVSVMPYDLRDISVAIIVHVLALILLQQWVYSKISAESRQLHPFFANAWTISPPKNRDHILLVSTCLSPLLSWFPMFFIYFSLAFQISTNC